MRRSTASSAPTRGLMTTYAHDRALRRGPVSAVISGNRTLETMRAQDVRFAGYDGRLGDLGTGLSPALMPLVSDNWTKHFTWQGAGEMPAEERSKLHRLVDQAHAGRLPGPVLGHPGPGRGRAGRGVVGAARCRRRTTSTPTTSRVCSPSSSGARARGSRRDRARPEGAAAWRAGGRGGCAGVGRRRTAVARGGALAVAGVGAAARHRRLRPLDHHPRSARALTAPSCSSARPRCPRLGDMADLISSC